MSTSLIAALSWLALANLVGMVPSKHAHWPQAYVLIVVGIPILGFVFVHDGPWIGLAVLLAAASILRWPLRYLARWIGAQLRLRKDA